MAADSSGETTRRGPAKASGWSRRRPPRSAPAGPWSRSPAASPPRRSLGRPPSAPLRPPGGRSPPASQPPRQPTGFIPPMLCTLVERAPEGSGWIHEIKLDGYRMQAVIAGGKARLLTRNGHDWTERFPETAAALGRLPDAILDGEIVAADAQGNPDFAALQAAMEQERTGDAALLCLRPAGARWREPVRPADRGAEDGAALPPERRARDGHLRGGLRPACGRPAPLRLPDRARGHRLQTRRLALPPRGAQRHLGQGEMPGQ